MIPIVQVVLMALATILGSSDAISPEIASLGTYVIIYGSMIAANLVGSRIHGLPLAAYGWMLSSVSLKTMYMSGETNSVMIWFVGIFAWGVFTPILVLKTLALVTESKSVQIFSGNLPEDGGDSFVDFSTGKKSLNEKFDITLGAVAAKFPDPTRLYTWMEDRGFTNETKVSECGKNFCSLDNKREHDQFLNPLANSAVSKDGTYKGTVWAKFVEADPNGWIQKILVSFQSTKRTDDFLELCIWDIACAIYADENRQSIDALVGDHYMIINNESGREFRDKKQVLQAMLEPFFQAVKKAKGTGRQVVFALQEAPSLSFLEEVLGDLSKEFDIVPCPGYDKKRDGPLSAAIVPKGTYVYDKICIETSQIKQDKNDQENERPPTGIADPEGFYETFYNYLLLDLNFEAKTAAKWCNRSFTVGLTNGIDVHILHDKTPDSPEDTLKANECRLKMLSDLYDVFAVAGDFNPATNLPSSYTSAQYKNDMRWRRCGRFLTPIVQAEANAFANMVGALVLPKSVSVATNVSIATTVKCRTDLQVQFHKAWKVAVAVKDMIIGYGLYTTSSSVYGTSFRMMFYPHAKKDFWGNEVPWASDHCIVSSILTTNMYEAILAQWFFL